MRLRRSVLLFAVAALAVAAALYLASGPTGAEHGLAGGGDTHERLSSRDEGPIRGAREGKTGRETGRAARSTESAAVAAAPGRPHGRLVTERGEPGAGGLGIPAVDVELLVDGRVVARATTAASGAFELDFAPGPAARARVRPRADPRYRFVPPELALSPEQAAGEAPIELFGRPAEAAPWKGLVVDARTGEPLPFFSLQVFDSLGGDEKLETDSGGRFATLQEFGPGTLRLRLSDFDGSRGRYGLQTLERDDVHAVSEVRVEVGPTYRVRVEPPPGHVLTDFIVRAVAPGVRRIHSLGRAAPSRLREGSQTWVRLHPSETPFGMPGPWELVLVSDDGAWRGSALVDALEGVYPEVVSIGFEPQGRVRGRVEDETGAPVAALPLLLAPLASGPEVRGQTDFEGRFDLPAVPAGEYRLTCSHRAYVPFEEAVSVVHGEDAVLRLVARARPVAGAIRGRIATESGRDGGDCRVTFEQDGFEVAWAKAAWSGGVALFELASVPTGDGRLVLEQSLPVLPVEPAELFLRAPAEGVLFTLHDDVPRVTLVFDVRDEATGAPLAGAHDLWCSPIGTFPVATEIDDVPLVPDLEWGVRTNGGARAFGGLAEIAGEGARRTVHARVATGWTARLVTYDAEGLRSIAGVVVVLDGEPLAPTDAAGRTFARRARRPERLSVTGGGWRLAEGLVNPISGRLADCEEEGEWYVLDVPVRRAR